MAPGMDSSPSVSHRPPLPPPSTSSDSLNSPPDPPEEFICPLSLDIMVDPVIVDSGQTYERAFIERWLRDGNRTCPKTRQILSSRRVFPNHVLRVLVHSWCEAHGVSLKSQEETNAAAAAGPAPVDAASAAAAAVAAANAALSERRQRIVLARLAEIQRLEHRAVERGGRRDVRRRDRRGSGGNAGEGEAADVAAPAVRNTPVVGPRPQRRPQQEAQEQVAEQVDPVTTSPPPAAGVPPAPQAAPEVPPQALPVAVSASNAAGIGIGGTPSAASAAPAPSPPAGGDEDDRYGNGVPEGVELPADGELVVSGWPGKLAMKAQIFQAGRWDSEMQNAKREGGVEGKSSAAVAAGGGGGSVAAGAGGEAEVAAQETAATAVAAGAAAASAINYSVADHQAPAAPALAAVPAAEHGPTPRGSIQSFFGSFMPATRAAHAAAAASSSADTAGQGPEGADHSPHPSPPPSSSGASMFRGGFGGGFFSRKPSPSASPSPSAGTTAAGAASPNDSFGSLSLQSTKEFTGGSSRGVSPMHPASASASPAHSSSSASPGRLSRMDRSIARAISRDMRQSSLSRSSRSSEGSSSIREETQEEEAEEEVLDIEELVVQAKEGPEEERAAAAALLRVVTRQGPEKRAEIVEKGGVRALGDLLWSDDPPTAEHAVTALLNLSLETTSHEEIMGSMLGLLHLLEAGSPWAKANAAAAVFSLCRSNDDARTAVLAAEGPALLVDILMEPVNERVPDPSACVKAKSDAAKALVAICKGREARAPVTRAGAVSALADLVRDGWEEVEEAAGAVFGMLARDADGREALANEGGIPALAELVEGGSPTSREFAVIALLGLAVHKREWLEAIDEEGIAASVDVLSRTGSQKAQGKASSLLELLRSVEAAEY